MSGDANYSDVALLIHFDGADASTSFVDNSPLAQTVSIVGTGAQVDTAQSVFGGAAGLFPNQATPSYLTVPDNAALTLAGDFTIELRFRVTAALAQYLLLKGPANDATRSFTLQRSGAGNILFDSTTNGTTALHPTLTITGASALNTWFAIAVTRSGNTVRGYVNGTLITSQTASGAMFDSTDLMRIGGSQFGAAGGDIWIDDLRITKGVARYTGASYTLDSAAFPDSGPVNDATAAVTLEFLVVDGTDGVANGAVNLLQLSATGADGNATGAGTIEVLSGLGLDGNGLGAASLQQMTASGAGDGVAAVALEQMTASAAGFSPIVGVAAVSLSQLAVAGVGLTGFDAFGAIVMSPMTGTGTHEVNNTAVGVATAEELAAFGFSPPDSATQLEQVVASGVGLTGQLGSGAALLLPVAALGALAGENPAAGTAVFQALTALAAGGGDGMASAAISLYRAQASAAGISGTAGSAALLLKSLAASGVAYSDSMASGAIVIAQPAAYGIGDAAVLAAFRAWVMNTRNSSVTEYTNYAYNSFARVGGVYLAAGPTGVYELSGADDAGTAVPWLVRTGHHDDKKPVLKRLPEILMGVRTDKPIRVRVLKDDNLSYEYTVPQPRTSDLQQVRVKTGKGLRSRYYAVELSGEGSQFEMDSLQLTMPETTRRVG